MLLIRRLQGEGKERMYVEKHGRKAVQPGHVSMCVGMWLDCKNPKMPDHELWYHPRGCKSMIPWYRSQHDLQIHSLQQLCTCPMPSPRVCDS